MSDKNIKLPAKAHHHAKNPRKITAQNKLTLRKNLSAYGDLSGFVVNYDGTIISGNQRAKIIDLNTSKIRIVKQYDKPELDGTTAIGFIQFQGSNEEFPIRYVYWTDEETIKKAMLIANTKAGSFSNAKLMSEFSTTALMGGGFSETELRSLEKIYKIEEAKTKEVLAAEARVKEKMNNKAAIEAEKKGLLDTLSDDEDINLDLDDEDDYDEDIPPIQIDSDGTNEENDFDDFGEEIEVNKKPKTERELLTEHLENSKRQDEEARQEKLKDGKKRYKHSTEELAHKFRIGKTYFEISEAERLGLYGLLQFYYKKTNMNLGFATFLLNAQNEEP